ncbi:MAG: class I SAM-dependent methyltransferase [Bacteroidetes bacterium]|nr:class I SAM-dependent methyltransferase [Bacteroidota bacterium]
MQSAPGNCFLCGKNDFKLWAKATDVEYFTTNDYYNFYECPNCKLLQIDPVPVDKLSVIYPSNYYSFAEQKQTLVNSIKEWLDKRLFRKILNGLPGNDLKLLDVGGGNGWLLNVIKSITNRVGFTQVVDLDPDAEKLANDNGHAYFCGRIEDFNTDQKFDFALLLNLIEHVKDPLAVLQKIENILTPTGIVLIKTPNYDALDARVFRHKNWGGLHCPRHWVIFTKDSITKAAEKAGLKVKQFSYTQGAPFWAVSIMAWLNKKGMVKIGKDKPAFYHPVYKILIGLFAGFDILRKPLSKPSQMFIILSK